MDLQHLFDILMGIIVTIVGFFAKEVHNSNKETAKELAAGTITIYEEKI